ncbi:MAG: sulfite exporter TauE/SafE family protein [Clostridiales bacterium]|nr:sulfite exporter TauE/SafE family protein [Candidatus Crickella merdequi]
MDNYDFAILSLQGLLVCAAYLLGGTVDAVCGGGGLLTVPALLSTGMPAHMVVGTNLMAAVPGCGMALYKYSRSGNVDYQAGWMSVPFIVIGAFLGTRLNLVMSDRFLQLLMLFLVPVLAAVTFIQKNSSEEDSSSAPSGRRKFFGVAAVTLLVSTYHAFYGPASGTFYMIFFAMVLKCGMVKGNGLARFVLLWANLLAGILYARSGFMCWEAIVPTCACYIAGNYMGASIAVTKGARFVRPVYYCVLALLFAKLVADFF